MQQRYKTPLHRNEGKKQKQEEGEEVRFMKGCTKNWAATPVTSPVLKKTGALLRRNRKLYEGGT